MISFAGGVFTVQGSHTYATGLGTPGDLGNTLCDATAPYYHKAITVSITHESAPVAQAVSDAKISLPEGSAHVAADGSLIVVGTQGDDKIQFEPDGNAPRSVKVQLGSTKLGTFTLGVGGRIVVAALAGDDDIQVAGGIGLDTALYAGPGDDRIKGGGGRNIEVGCEGDDQINAGRLGDLLVGGTGSDRIVGGSGDDLMVAGTIVDMTNIEDDRYFDLVGILTAGRINLPFRAMDDNAVDRLTGAAGVDVAYYNILGAGAKDVFTDKAEFAFDI
jgi:Ca2+-binding RTX toxin-like protein